MVATLVIDPSARLSSSEGVRNRTDGQLGIREGKNGENPDKESWVEVILSGKA